MKMKIQTIFFVLWLILETNGQSYHQYYFGTSTKRKFYYFSENTEKSSQAEEQCANKLMATLARPTTQEESDFLTRTSRDYCPETSDPKDVFNWVCSYIGVYDREGIGLVDLHDDPFTFSDWDNEEPNNLISIEECVGLANPHNNQTGWYDINCDAGLRYICEIDAPRTDGEARFDCDPSPCQKFSTTNTRVTHSQMKCSQYCLRDDSCFAFTFNTSNKVCSLATDDSCWTQADQQQKHLPLCKIKYIDTMSGK